MDEFDHSIEPYKSIKFARKQTRAGRCAKGAQLRLFQTLEVNKDISIIMATYIKSLIMSLIAFAIMYLGLTTIVRYTLTTTPSFSTFNFINVLAFMCWVIASYFFAVRIKRLGIINGVVLGICTLAIIVPHNMHHVNNGTIDLVELLIPFIGIGIVLGAIGGGIYDIQHFMQRKFSNKASKPTAKSASA